MRAHFVRGLTLKLYACILLGLVYQFYYGFGDTLNYFRHGKFLASAILDSPLHIFNYLFSSEDGFYRYFNYYIDQQFEASYYFKTANITMVKITALCNFLSLGGFFGTGFIFCFFAYLGQWKIFKVFYNAYPDIGDKFVYSLYVPSIVFWSSGILKDSFCLGCIGIIISVIENGVVVKSKAGIAKILLVIVCAYMVLLIKAYIIICLAIPLIIWRLSITVKKIGIKILGKLYLWIGMVMPIIIYKVAHIGELLGGVSLEIIYLAMLQSRTGFEGSSESDSSSFNLGEFSPTVGGFLGQMPKAINAVIFRPYIWETKKIFSLVAAGESTMFMLIAIYVVYKTGLKTTFKIIFTNPDVLFCLLFTVLFAAALGLTVANFGALVRFKIQFLPFLVIGLILIYYKKMGREQTLASIE